MRAALFRAGLAMVFFATAANAPYAYLIQNFGYDDVLREPPEAVLAAFTAGGDGLVFAWAAFALCALFFVVVAGLADDALRAAGAKAAGFVFAAGVLSGLAQAIGLSRWTFAIPVIADLAAEEETRAAALVSYRVLHQFAGVAIGEHIGQTLLAIWTAGISWALVRGGAGPRVIGWLGFVIAPAWIVGQTELLATVTQTPVIEITPYAFMGWELWIFALGVSWIWRSMRAERGVQVPLS
jgi:hypothetical protein